MKEKTCCVTGHRDIPAERMAHVAQELRREVLAAMERDGRRVLLDGTNATDDPANRPGFRALAELGVRSPLREAVFTKDDVRAASRAMSLSTADKPNFSCFATKVPPGEPLTRESLGQVAHSLGMQLSIC